MQRVSFGLKIWFIKKLNMRTCLCDNHITPIHTHCVKIHFLNFQVGGTGRIRRCNTLLKLFDAILYSI